MHGPGIAQPLPNGTPNGTPSGTPSPGMIAFLRVIFVALPLLTCGFLAWAATLRVAIVTRSTLNWTLFVGNGVLNIMWVVFLAQDNTDDFSSPEGNVGMIGMLSTGTAAIAYYLYADFKHYGARQRLHAGYYPPPVMPQQQQYQPPASAGYGYGAPTRPMAGPPAQQQPQPQPVPPQPVPPQPNHAAPPRIDQVRAELDELSDLLRRDGRDGRDGRDSGDGDRR
ncbi:hypothetical protein [Streptomyces sp. NBC_01506]|uniref:hypothetical protein n=1 Tax=Streptomyces sp. NBC_01506 TaxID=2903887 RepID=UPI003867A308